MQLVSFFWLGDNLEKALGPTPMLNWFRKLPKATPSPAAAPPPSQPPAVDSEQILQTLLKQVVQGKTWGYLRGILLSKSVKPEQLANWLHLE